MGARGDSLPLLGWSEYSRFLNRVANSEERQGEDVHGADETRVDVVARRRDIEICKL